MEKFKIKWTSRAKKDLRKIYTFYTELAGEEKAYEIITTLLDRIDILSEAKYVKIGAIDEQFSHLIYQYKKLIVKNIKITYRLSTSRHVVYINRIFETRQNPSKNK